MWLWFHGYVTLFVVMNGAERWKNVKGKQSFQFALAYNVYSDGVFFLNLLCIHIY